MTEHAVPTMTRLLAVAGLAFATCRGAVAADEATPTPTPTAAPTAAAQATPAGRRSLADVARDTRLQGAEAGSTPIVISNDNLGELASQGGLTEAGPTATPTALPGSRRAVHGGATADSTVVTKQHDQEEAGMQPGDEEKRRHWRAIYLKQVETIEAIGEQINYLDEQIPGLWNQFYTWDDPAYRDGVIKPKLDAALAQRQQLEEQLADEEARLPEILEQARRDGALPGWFRDLPQPTPSTGQEREEWGVQARQP